MVLPFYVKENNLFLVYLTITTIFGIGEIREEKNEKNKENRSSCIGPVSAEAGLMSF